MTTLPYLSSSNGFNFPSSSSSSSLPISSAHLRLSSPNPPSPPPRHGHGHGHGHRHRLKEKKILRMTTNIDSSYDRFKEVKEFDDSKIGVKGLVDRGLSTIPRFFLHQPDSTISNNPSNNSTNQSKPFIPVIDLSSPRSILVDQVRDSASSLGFFQIINHGISVKNINYLLDSIHSFNDLPESEKMQFYGRNMTHGAAFSTNFDLFQSKAASWRDTLQLRLGPNPPDWDYVPGSCKEAIIMWDKEVKEIGKKLLGLLSEGLGLENVDVLEEMSCLEKRIMVCHYYPWCPQPELTAGLTSHTDPGVLTVLVQNEVPGLLVKVGEEWVDVEPVEGAIVINIGDILQIMSNDKYKSVEHKVVANPFKKPRVSVAVFFNPSLGENLFGPLPQLVTPDKPAKFKQFIFNDYMNRFFSKELDGNTLINFYRV